MVLAESSMQRTACRVISGMMFVRLQPGSIGPGRLKPPFYMGAASAGAPTVRSFWMKQ